MENFNKYWLAVKKYWWVIPVVAVLVYILVLNVKMNRLSDQKQLQDVELSTLKDNVASYVTKNGQLVSQVTSVNIEKDNLKESLSMAGFDIKKLREENIKWRNIANALKVEIESSGHGKTGIRDTFYIVNNDTIPIGSFKWTNNYLDISGKIMDKELSFDYLYRTSLNIIQTPQKKSTLVTVTLSDPNATVTSANSITVVHKKKIWERGGLMGAIGIVVGLLIPK